MSGLSVTEARAVLPELLDRVAAGEEITITRHGKPAAVLLRPDAVRSRRAAATIRQAREIAARLEAARTRPLPESGLTPDRAEAMIREVGRGRDRG